MNTPNNLRSKTTKKCIRKALLELLEEGETPDTVSVKRLCERAGINRSTFYTHYTIPGEVYREMENEALEMALIHLSNLNVGNETSKIESLLRYIKENHSLMQVFFLPFKENLFFEKMIQRANLGLLYSRFDTASFIAGYLYAFSIEGSRGILSAWVSSGCKESEKDIAKLLITVNQYSIFGVQKEIECR